MGVKIGDTVTLHYVGKFEDGEIFDSSFGGEPLEFVVGSNEVIPGFEEGVIGMEVGEKRTINIPVDKAYGPVKEELIFPVKKSNLPEEIEVGGYLEVQQPDGNGFIVKIADIKGDTVYLDANHPFAGKNLIFEVEVVSIK
ncbi:FKBP-type peptidyl-prolyl cis-trans isomerase [Thermosipho atlanticus]|uniref:Peptidyl-prolyl cis-trans isomerase n=1 Tax=Thermosipho atlanticus DSM 15807 TaxID=1123380 RepID=A0A1M5S314_9BACT|nr:peptidylprolyl isomerase [Thermosipho atlanticus]SHH32874.1 FKBP-type peptidyl-prolyl cis-trans isomerase 2 [Thermosipho atlanticus DSM 15807]